MIFTPDQLRPFEDLPVSITDDELLPHIRAAEIDWLRGILGADLYDDLEANDTPANAELINRLLRTMAHMTWYKLSTRFGVATQGKGFVIGRGQYEDAARFEEVERAGMNARQRAESEMSLVIEWLNANSSTYPLYKTTCKPRRSTIGVFGTLVNPTYPHDHRFKDYRYF
jgi:hypothetical protein